MRAELWRFNGKCSCGKTILNFGKLADFTLLLHAFASLSSLPPSPRPPPSNFLEADDVLGPWKYHRCHEL